MLTDTDGRAVMIETGRTWRDIPPNPPTEAPPRHPVVAESVEVPATHRQRRVLAGVGLGLIALLGLMIWGPWRGDASGADVAAAGPAKPTSTLPEQIIPDPAPAPATPDPLVPNDVFGGIPDLPGLSDFLDRQPGSFGDIVPAGLDLIEVTAVPDGYRIRGTSYSSSAGRTTEQVTLVGPVGPITVRAARDGGATLPAGESHEVGGALGSLESEDPIRLSWFAEDDLLVTVEAPAAAGLDLVDEIAQGVEVTG